MRMYEKKLGPFIEYSPEDTAKADPIVAGHVVQKIYKLADFLFRWELFLIRTGKPVKLLYKGTARSKPAAEEAGQDYFQNADFTNIT